MAEPVRRCTPSSYWPLWPLMLFPNMKREIACNLLISQDANNYNSHYSERLLRQDERSLPLPFSHWLEHPFQPVAARN